MSAIEFTSNSRFTLGVEIELQLVDRETGALKNCITELLEHIPEHAQQRIKPELMQSYIEINTGVCDTVSDVEADLRKYIKVAEEAAEKCGVELLWLATHPFSRWHEQKVTPDARYERLIENLQDTARRLVTFGLHVHVGVNSGDKAVMVCDRILRHLPKLLAISVNSPFWQGRCTGLNSQRSKVMESLPTAGLPPLMRNWSEYTWLINHMVQTNFLESIREIWWDVRPHHNFGTVEIRICDMPGDLDTVLAITALCQCLVQALSYQIDEGTYLFDCHPMIVQQNKWRAGRYGLDSILVDPYTFETRPLRLLITDLVKPLREHAQELKCQDYLQSVLDLIDRPSGAQKQIEIFKKTGSLEEVVRQSLQRS